MQFNPIGCERKTTLPAMFDTPISTNDLSIDRVAAAGLPVILIFLDGNPGAALGESMNRLARENAGALLLAKVIRKDNPVSSGRFGISQTPALVTLAGGQVKSKAENIDASDLAKHATYLLGKGPRPEAGPASTEGNRPSPRPSYAYNSVTNAHGATPLHVTDRTFEQEVLHSPTPVLVDFWASWCGPCRMVEPIVEKLARELAGRLKVAKVNVDENPGLSQRYDIRSIPTMMVVKNGQIVDRWMGALPEANLRNRLSAMNI
jgi:thioredoxin 1